MMAANSADSQKRKSILPDLGSKIAALDELRHDETESVVGASNVINRHDLGMVQTGEDASFVQVCLHILGLRVSFGAGNFDRNGAVEIIITGPERPHRTRPCPSV